MVVRLEVGGETKYTSDGKPQHEKMSVQCNLDYFERILEAPPPPMPSGVPSATIRKSRRW